MIIKEKDKKKTNSPFQKAGDSAEKQMAHYLKRAFQECKDIHVINDLRLVKNDDTAQIDHLIIHRFGFIVIESKSVTTKISVNDHGEWVRSYQNKLKGMPSPIKQAERQADFLKKFLNEESKSLLKQTILFKSTLSDFKYDVLVAISDSGIIDRPNNLQLAEVHKADQVVDKINSIISEYKGAKNKVLSLKVNRSFADSSLDRIKTYLSESHTPIPQKTEVHESSTLSYEHKSQNKKIEINESKASYKTAIETEKPTLKALEKNNESKSKIEQGITCSKCNSKNIEIIYGKFGYFIRCSDCNGSTSINLKCKTSDCKVRLRKDKLNFYQECSVCDSSDLYFVNSDDKQIKTLNV